MKPTNLQKLMSLPNLILCTLLLCAVSLNAQIPLQTIGYGTTSYTVVGDKLRIRTEHISSVEELSGVLPQGYTVVSQLLPPAQTHWFSQSYQNLLRTRAPFSIQERELYAAEHHLIRWFTISIPEGVSLQKAEQKLREVGLIDRVEYWAVYPVQATPNDVLLVQQEYLTVIKALEAWEIQTAFPSVTIGIIDNGVNQGHEDLVGSISPNTNEIPRNGIDDDANGYIDDYEGYNFTWSEDNTTDRWDTFNATNNGHGTNVAGIACAEGNNGKGIVGVGFGAKLFPMKVAQRSGGGIVYGYEALIYAANRGIKVVNCSWGGVRPYSELEQGVIDFCLAKGTVVVASAGNHGAGSTMAYTQLNYPAAYSGVIGVAETATDDRYTATSALGVNAMVSAPGNQAYTTSVGGAYSAIGISGTSFASPMAAGLAAVVCSKYPELSPREIGSYIRATADDIRSLNNKPAAVHAPRINMLSAVQRSPSTTKAVRLVSTRMVNTQGQEIQRYGAGDTIGIVCKVRNDFAAVGQTTFMLSIAEATNWEIIPISTQLQRSGFVTKEEVELEPLFIQVNTTSFEQAVLGLAIGYDGINTTYPINLKRPNEMTTFKNQVLQYSIGDNGKIGFSSSEPSTQDGLGMQVQATGARMFGPCGFTFSASNNASSAFTSITSHMSTVKAFSPGSPNIAEFNDSKQLERPTVGLTMRVQCTFPSDTMMVAVWNCTLTNTTDNTLENPAGGAIIDWDVENLFVNNNISFAPDVIPVPYNGKAAAQIASRIGAKYYGVSAAFSLDPTAEIQSAGIVWDDYFNGGLSTENNLLLLNSGTSIQTTNVDDISAIAGARFPGTLAPGESRKFGIVIGVGTTAELAKQSVRKVLANPALDIQEVELPAKIFPSFVTDKATIQFSAGTRTIRIADISGNTLSELPVEAESTSCVISVNNLVSGVYTAQCIGVRGVEHVVFMVNK